MRVHNQCEDRTYASHSAFPCSPSKPDRPECVCLRSAGKLSAIPHLRGTSWGRTKPITRAERGETILRAGRPITHCPTLRPERSGFLACTRPVYIAHIALPRVLRGFRSSPRVKKVFVYVRHHAMHVPSTRQSWGASTTEAVVECQLFRELQTWARG